MKNLRLVIGILSLVLIPATILESCALVIGTEGEIVGESSGILFEISLTIAGVSAICTRKGIVGGFVSGILYIIVGIFGVQNTGVYAPLMMNGIIAFICAFVFILTILLAILTLALWPLQLLIRKIRGKGISKKARTKRKSRP